MGFLKDIKRLTEPYFVVNIILSLSYLIAKRVTFVCNVLFPGAECELDMRESEILFFLLIVVMIRTRKSGSVTMINYLSSSFVYTKVANLILWFYADARMGIVYGVIFVLLALLLPEPTISGPENIVYFRASGLDEELERNKKVTWLVVFYTAWNPSCVNFAPVYSRLSYEYALENLKFGKVDIGRFPEVARKYRISDSATSKQLPTIILFKEGKEVTRRPAVDSKGKIMKFFFSEDNVKAAFDLNNLYNECKSNPLKTPKKKKQITEGGDNGDMSSNHLKEE
ncbi:thioredoxin-related transmembrane protein 2 homolog [Ischnura elegans]|uniref:thioredoxin-related transmembrane protein 2 homolog n=1 Tax=Ischnura elegans TaxID=197161 RepID=UPI001ED8BFA3|nr:thioredoxin-related transmembrane protein 2 homolog [Ischnura elegans]